MRRGLKDVRSCLWCGACALIFGSLAVVTSAAQTANTDQPRPSRRITNPVRGQRPPLPPDGDDLRIISTAEEEAADAEEGQSRQRATRRDGNTRSATRGETESELRRTVERLSRQVSRLSAELGDMREQQRSLVDLERLSRAEQRAENYRAQLRDVVAREATLQARLDQISIDILPQNIEARAAGAGSLRAEEVRDQMRRLLENERARVQTQLDLLAQSRVRLEQVILNTDTEVARLSARLDETAQTSQMANDNVAQPVVTPLPAPATEPPPADVPPQW